MSTETQELNREDLQKIWDEEVAGNEPAAEAPPEPAATRSGEAENQQDDGQPADKEAAEPPQQPDPMDEIRARLGVLDRLEQRVRNTEGHIGGLTSELSTFRKELKAAATAAATVAPGTAPNQTQIAAAAKNLEKWESLKSDFPEWADAIDERLGAAASPPPSINVDELRQQVAAELTPRLKAEIEASMEPRLVDVAHRGWRTLVNTPDFVQWINAQPENVRQLAASPKADDAIDLLDRYKETRKVLPKTSEEITAERQARLRQAANTPRGQGANTPRRSADDMTDEEYWQYLAKQGASR